MFTSLKCTTSNKLNTFLRKEKGYTATTLTQIIIIKQYINLRELSFNICCICESLELDKDKLLILDFTAEDKHATFLVLI